MRVRVRVRVRVGVRVRCVMSHHLGSECVSPLAATMHGWVRVRVRVGVRVRDRVGLGLG